MDILTSDGRTEELPSWAVAASEPQPTPVPPASRKDVKGTKEGEPSPPSPSSRGPGLWRIQVTGKEQIYVCILLFCGTVPRLSNPSFLSVSEKQADYGNTLIKNKTV